MHEHIAKNIDTVGIRLLMIVLILVFAGTFIFLGLEPGWLNPHDVSLRQLHEHPTVYAGQQVRVVGYLVKHTSPQFEVTYTLCEGDPRNLYFAENPCVAVTGTVAAIDPYSSFLHDGKVYEVALSPCSFAVPCRVVVSGVLTDRGSVIDLSQHVIEASSVTWHE